VIEDHEGAFLARIISNDCQRDLAGDSLSIRRNADGELDDFLDDLGGGVRSDGKQDETRGGAPRARL
jgi:hypothetical protein